MLIGFSSLEIQFQNEGISVGGELQAEETQAPEA